MKLFVDKVNLGHELGLSMKSGVGWGNSGGQKTVVTTESDW